ncbi:MAG: MmcQ/YjbR family DNA-binding protein [Planctomycetota bacterium]|jgi:hypothetical protein
MPNRLQGLLDELSAILNAQPGVFSTPQWGGRAYKLPGPGGRKAKPKLLAFVALAPTANAAEVSFKLPPERAQAVLRQHEWISPHPFRTLAPAGWLVARVSTRRRLATLTKLLKESRALYGSAEDAPREPARPVAGSNAIARRIDRVMRELRAEGWSPPEERG